MATGLPTCLLGGVRTADQRRSGVVNVTRNARRPRPGVRPGLVAGLTGGLGRAGPEYFGYSSGRSPAWSPTAIDRSPTPQRCTSFARGAGRRARSRGILEASAARPGSGLAQGRAPAAAEAPRLAGLRLGSALLGGLRHRGDAAGPRAGRRVGPAAAAPHCRVGVGALLVVVIASYRQTVREYPNGGGSYIVAKENLGLLPGLTAAARDPGLLRADGGGERDGGRDRGDVGRAGRWPTYKLPMAIAFIALITVANLRGAKEAGKLFAIPTYGFVRRGRRHAGAWGAWVLRQRGVPARRDRGPAARGDIRPRGAARPPGILVGRHRAHRGRGDRRRRAGVPPPTIEERRLDAAADGRDEHPDVPRASRPSRPRLGVRTN